MSALRPVYCKYCGQTLFSDNLERCSACEKVGGVMDPGHEAAMLADLVARKQGEPEPALETVERAVRGYRLFKLGCAGVVSIFLGFAMILIPDFRDNPRTISLNDVGRGLCAAVVGFVLIGLFYLSTRRS